MPIFGEASSPYDEYIEKVTAETLTNENWELMIDICDRVNADPKGPKQCLLSLKKRLNHRDPHVVLLALSLLDCLWNNCGQKFRHEISSKEFIDELSYKCTNSNRVVAEKARSFVKKWSENECKQDSSLSLVESLYKELIDQGYSFEADPSSAKKAPMFSNDPNVVSNDQEEADIAKAIAMSLQENNTKKQQFNSASAYPSLRNNDSGLLKTNGPATTSQPNAQQQQQKKVLALHAFEAGEDNEISFSIGEIITVIDDSDQFWWRGANAKGQTGYFPTNFITLDLNDPSVQQICSQNEEKPVEVNGENEAMPKNKVQIDENVLLRCIELIEGLDPTMDASTDPAELAFLENMAMAQAPLIDQKLMQIDKQLNQLADVDLAIRDVLGAYDNAVQQVAAPASSGAPPPNSMNMPAQMPISSAQMSGQNQLQQMATMQNTATITGGQQQQQPGGGNGQW